MTLWLDVETVRVQIGGLFDGVTEVWSVDTDSERPKIKIRVESQINLTSIQLGSIESYLSAIGDGDPVMCIESDGGALVLSLEADQSVYRDN